MITVNHVVKTFDGFRALDELHLTVPDGAVYGLVGPNGAGKTTLIRHLTGVVRPDSGEVLFNGAPVYENVEVKSRIASISDEIYYFPQATIRDMMRHYRGIYPRFDDARYQQLGQVFNLDDHRQMRRLSKGQLRQAAFWIALCTQPDFLILDEPVDGLDPVMRRQVWRLILDELEDVCDHVGIMHQGKMLLEHSLAELQDNIVKVQLVTENPLPKDLTVLHESATGRVRTLIIRGGQRYVSDRISATLPIFFDVIPLSLEEIFIYELGGVDHAVKNIVL